MMLCRVAEDVLWMSRYVERSLAVGRLIEVSQHLEFDEHDDPAMRAARWAPLLEPRPDDGPLPSQVAMVAVEREAARTVRQWLAFNRENPRSIVACIDRARTAARQVRERISSWMSARRRATTGGRSSARSVCRRRTFRSFSCRTTRTPTR